MQRFKSLGSAQRILALTPPSSTFSMSNATPLPASTHRIFRAAAMSTWREAVPAAKNFRPQCGPRPRPA